MIRLDIRSFPIGVVAGSVSIALVWAGTAWWGVHAARSSDDEALYDRCLASNQGNTVACGAFMRTYDRERVKSAALEKMLREGGANMLAAGHNKREVVDWARSMGGVGSQLSDAAGISLKDLQDGKY
jgi:hypothetical protein